jgi:capsular polysaccharide biosynthesis protein
VLAGSHGDERRRLLDAFTVRRDRPANLRPEDERLFRHEYERSFGPTDVFTLRNVHLTGDGVFIRGLRPLRELRYVPQEKMGPRYVARSLLRRRRRFDADGTRYVTAFNRWSPGNYFHWMCDVLPRVLLVRDVVEGATFVLPSSHAVHFVEDSLAPFAPAAVEFFSPDELAYFREVIVPGHIALTGNYHEPTMRALAEFLRRSLAGDTRAAPDDGPLVYVTRKSAQHRYVLNEAEVVDVVRGHGFEVVANEELSLAGQIALYSRARALIGIMGANLTNVLFMPPRSALLQLTRAGDASNHLYYALAEAMGVRFYYQQCAAVEGGFGIRWNLTVDANELDANIRALL